MTKNNSSSSETSATSLFVGLASLSAGAYHGFFDAQGIPIEKENLEFVLTYGPAIVQAGLGAAILGVVGLIGGAFGETDRGLYFERKGTLERIAKRTGETAVGTVGGALIGGASGGVTGGFQTLIGYSAGYLTGWALK